MRKIGSVVLKLGLVNIPMGVNSFLDYAGVSFKQLCPDCLNPVGYKRWCSHDNKEVEYHSLKQGIEVARNQFVEVPKNLMDGLSRETRIIGVIPINTEREFIQEKCYLLTPDKLSSKSYFLLRDLLVAEGVELVVECALRKKQHLAIIKTVNIRNQTWILLKQILYAEAIKEISEMKEEALTEAELSMGKELFKVVEKNLPNTTYENIKDERRETIRQLLEGKVLVATTEPTPTTNNDLMEQLKASITLTKDGQKEKEREVESK